MNVILAKSFGHNAESLKREKRVTLDYLYTKALSLKNHIWTNNDLNGKLKFKSKLRILEYTHTGTAFANEA